MLVNSVRRRDFELLAACQIAENCYLIGNAEKREYVSAGVTAAEGSAERLDLDDDGISYDFDLLRWSRASIA